MAEAKFSHVCGWVGKSAAGMAFHVDWCQRKAPRASERAAAPVRKARAGDHDGRTCEAAHEGIGHVTYAIREGKRLAGVTPAPAPAKPTGGRKASKRAKRQQAKANAAGLRQNAKAAVAPAVTPSVSPARPTSGPARDEATPVRVPGTPDVIDAAERIVRTYGALTSTYDDRFDRLESAVDAIAAALGVRMNPLGV